MQRKLFIEYLNTRLQAFLAEKSKNDFFKEHFPKIYSELGKKEQTVYDRLEQKFDGLNAEVENLLAKVSKAYQIQDSKNFDKEIKEAMILAFTTTEYNIDDFQNKLNNIFEQNGINEKVQFVFRFEDISL